MISLSYTISPSTKNLLDHIEDLRHKILFTPIPPHVEIRLKFDAIVDRIYYGGFDKESKVKRNDVLEILSQPLRMRASNEKLQTLYYKTALDYCTYEWLASTKPITQKTIFTLYEFIVARELKKRDHPDGAKTKLIDYFLDYLQLYPENPVIEAAIAHVQIREIAPFKKYNTQLANLVTLAFLYKYGFDCRGLLTIERHFIEHNIEYSTQIEQTIQTGKLTPWLDFFTHAMARELERKVKDIETLLLHSDTSSNLIRLTERQKKILHSMIVPDMRLTNRQVQKWFRISQITASRDLAVLSNIGLLYAHGKGRSVYYTRI